MAGSQIFSHVRFNCVNSVKTNPLDQLFTSFALSRCIVGLEKVSFEASNSSYTLRQEPRCFA